MNSKTKKMLLLAGTAAAGGALLYASTRRKYSGIKLKSSVIIGRPAGELYSFWRDFENLPRFANILESVQVLDDNRSRWTVMTPGGIRVSWDAEITKDIENEMIGWRSIEGSTVETAGYVRFEQARGGRGTLVRVALEYNPPAGRIGAAAASMAGSRPGAHVDEFLRRFKQLMETGEIAVGDALRSSDIGAKSAEQRRVS